MEDNKIKEEVAITPIIKDIELLFGKISRFIGSVLKGILNGLSAFLLFFLKNFKVFGIAIIAGALIGAFSFKIFPKTYSSNLTLTTNIEAKEQLYSDINYFNALIRNQPNSELSEIFQLSDTRLNTLVGISVKSSPTYSERIKLIDNYYITLDSNTTEHIDFDNFLSDEELSMSSRFDIQILSTDPTIFSKLEAPIMEFLEKDENLQGKRKKELTALKYRKSILEKEMELLDSLKVIYNKALLVQAESKKNGSLTTIQLVKSDESSALDPLEIYGKYMEYSQKIAVLNAVIETTATCYQVHSHFSPFGSNYSIGRINRMLIAIGIFIGLSYLILLVRLFLNAQKK